MSTEIVVITGGASGIGKALSASTSPATQSSARSISIKTSGRVARRVRGPRSIENLQVDV